jgi:prepilin-type N-terminal cleavage/methylation domain-containing protein
MTMKQRAFTLLEMMVAMAIVLVLFGAMITVTRRLKAESQRRLTASAIAVVSTALDQYYENTHPKQYPPQILNKAYFDTALYGSPPTNSVTVASGDLPDDNAATNWLWNSGAAYYFLSRVSQSKAILDSLSGQMISNRDLGGTAILIEIPAGAAATDWIRFADAWGMPVRYVYLGSGFPVLTSAGPDKIFDTEDDVVSQ